jgi:hypothetical protein
MPLFHHKDEENDKLRAELERISAMPLPALAAEAMVKGFGPGTKGAEGPTGMGTIAGAFNPAMISVGIDQNALDVMYGVTAEAVQVLEHAGLVRSDIGGGGSVYGIIWSATRLGKQALEQNAVERMLAGGSLQ